VAFNHTYERSGPSMDGQVPLQDAALQGLRVVELAQLVAGPMTGGLLADFGADVVHVEDKRYGDPARVTGWTKDGTHLWWKVAGRNKRSVTLDLRLPEGQEVARRLCNWADVVITNFRIGTLEAWGLDWETLQSQNPQLIMLQVTGYGATSSKRNHPGFGKIGEAMSGVVHVTGFPDGPPVHTGFSHADATTALFGAFAIQTALYRKLSDENFAGEYIDLALFEALYRLVEWQVVFFDQTGRVPQRAGNQLAIAPGAVINTYRSADDRWITVAAGAWRSVQKLAAFLGEPAEEYATPELQLGRTEHLDDLVRAYVAEHPAEEVLAGMEAAEVVASLIYDAADIVNDQTYAERDDVITVEDADLGPVRMQAVLPKLSNHPGAVWRTGPALGEDNELVLREYLGLSAEEHEALRASGAV
jgi:crotonobetainyl-CoA:carnitine CoA-transferase CaiB-like acyl-CoA transferase